MTSIWFSIFLGKWYLCKNNKFIASNKREIVYMKSSFFRKPWKIRHFCFSFPWHKKILWLNMEGNSEASIFHFTVQAAIFWSCSVRVNTVDRKANVFYGNTVAGLAANPALLAWITEGQLKKESYIWNIAAKIINPYNLN